MDDLRVGVFPIVGNWGKVFPGTFSHPARALVIRGHPPRIFFWVFTLPSIGPTKIWVEEAGAWVEKLSSPPQVSCGGKKLLSSVLERILCWFSHSVKAQGCIC